MKKNLSHSTLFRFQALFILIALILLSSFDLQAQNRPEGWVDNYQFKLLQFPVSQTDDPYNVIQERVSKSSLYRYLAFSHWLEGIETKNTSNNESAVNQDWYSTVIENIKKEEYNITYSDKIFAYQSPNRANNYRFIYYKDGFSVKPRQTKIPLFDESDKTIDENDKKYKTVKDWNITMRLHSFGKNGHMETFNCEDLNVNKNTAYSEDDNLRINYTNDEKGMRQDFVIKQKPEGVGFMEVRIKAETILKVITGAAGVVFKDSDGKEVMKYSGLKIWDAEGKELKGWFKKSSKNSFCIVVDDKFAVYPITIDPLSSSANWTAESDQAYSQFGICVSTAGDINGDGYSDVIVGAHRYDNGQNDEGRAFVYYGSLSGLSPSVNWTAESNQASARFGVRVSTAGDVNGDGFSDVIVGAHRYDNIQTDEGMVFVYHGSAGGLSTSADWTAEGDQAGAYFGSSVSTAGDVNGDGFSDVIVGADGYGNGESDEGRAYVYLGSASGLLTSADWIVESDQTGARFGNSVSTAGDVNGDGYSDVIVGAWLYDNDQTNEGRAFVYHGSDGGLSSSSNWTAESDQDSALFGCSVSTAGDVNGDGYSDVIVGARFYDNGQYREGMAFVYHGSDSGLSSSSNWTAESDQSNANFGRSVYTAGDVNGDGYSDVIVGAWFYDNGQTDEGRAFVYHGSSSGLSSTADWTAESNQANSQYGVWVSTAGDVNGDGYSDVIVGARYYDNGQYREGMAFVYHGSAGGLSTSANWTAESDQASSEFGVSVSTAGDVNGDGYSDVIVGAQSYDNGQIDEGRAFVYYGSAGGLSTSANWTAESDQVDAYFGSSVSTAGDVNGDGFSDVIVGAYSYSNGESDEGRAYVYLGSSGGLLTSADWTVESDQADAYFGSSVSTAGDVNGDGFSDVIVGAYGYGNGENDEGRAYVYLGSSGGLSTSVDWTFESNIISAHFGYCVSTAGDVNGDGFSDVIVGAYNYDSGQPGEGRAFVYHGSSSGLLNTAAWAPDGGQVNANFGWSVSTAGDVNGDGYSDVIVGAPYYDNGETDEGRAYVFIGSPSGLSSTESWIAESNQATSYFGYSVSTAGDVNGDGYSDVIVGAYNFYDNPNNGFTFVWHGSSSGLGLDGTSTNSDWNAGCPQSTAQFGKSVSNAGDVNGDGFSDVIIGAPYFDAGQSDEGMVFSYYGNETNGLDLKPRQWRSDLSTPVVSPLKSRSSSEIGLGILGRSFFGRTCVRIQFEIQPLGTAFGSGKGIGVTETADSFDVGTTGIQINQLISGLTDRTMYKWRMRIKYEPETAPPQPYSRWIYNVTSPNGPMVSGLQVSDDNLPLPVSLLSFTSSVAENNVTLKWSTLNEINNKGFSVQRKKEGNKGTNWVEVGFINGNGTTNQIHSYQFSDKNLQKGRYEYRLKQVDYNNNFKHYYLGAPVSIGVPAKFELSQNYPNSFNPTTKINFTLPTDGMVSLKVYDIMGRLITTLINNEYRTADYYTVEFNGSNYASGVYFYRLITEKNIATKKMLLVK